MEVLGCIVTRDTDPNVRRDHIIIQGPSGTGKTELLKKLFVKVRLSPPPSELFHSMLSFGFLCAFAG